MSTSQESRDARDSQPTQPPVISPALVALDVDAGRTNEEVIAYLASQMSGAGRTDDAKALAHAAITREQSSGTGVPGRVAIPHCRSRAVSTPSLAVARLSRPVDFSGPDGDASIVFLIAAPEGGGQEHLKILSKLARALVRSEFLERLRAAQSEQTVVDEVLGVINAGPKAKARPTSPAQPTLNPAIQPETQPTNIIAITACPTGIAHTYMAADALTQEAGKRSDVHLEVETQGSSANTPLAAETIANAKAVIFATDVGVRDKQRFAGIPVIECGVKKAINCPSELIDHALSAAKDPSARKVARHQSSAQSSNEQSDSDGGLSWPRRIQQAVMTGVSYMVPFVAAGGLLLALGFLVGGFEVANVWQQVVSNYSLSSLPHGALALDDGSGLVTPDHDGLALYLGAVLFGTGQAAMQFIVAALSGYTAYSLAGRPGVAPGFVGGVIAVFVGAGFIGGLVTGIIAGLVAMWIGAIRVPRWLASLMPVVVIPLLTSLTVGLVMYLFLGRPLASVMTGMTNWLNSMSGSSAVVLGIILGLMMCFDLGGPVNKAAYLFGTAGLSAGDEASMKIMAAVMTAGMVPPIALSVATFVRARLFTPAERENGKSAWLLGLSFVSEGAIPFAAADPLRVIPSMMLGGAVTGALSMALGVGSHAPHGGIFVLFAIDPQWAFIVALLAGVMVAAAAVLALKQLWPQHHEVTEEVPA